MVRVLTIRNPKTGALIAEEQIGPQDDRDKAVVRLFQKTLGPDAPELMLLSKTAANWVEDPEGAVELAREWGDPQLALIGPKSDPRLQQSHLILASVSERSPVSRMEYPLDRRELKRIREGKRHDALVPVPRDIPLAVGDTVTFREAASDPLGSPIVLPNGASVSVDLKRVRKRPDQWAGRDLYDITWDPKQVRVSPKKAPAHESP
jgi:hypothetical protein